MAFNPDISARDVMPPGSTPIGAIIIVRYLDAEFSESWSSYMEDITEVEAMGLLDLTKLQVLGRTGFLQRHAHHPVGWQRLAAEADEG